LTTIESLTVMGSTAMDTAGAAANTNAMAMRNRCKILVMKVSPVVDQ